MWRPSTASPAPSTTSPTIRQLAPDDKIARLDGFAAALTGKAAGPGFEKAERLRESLAATGVTAQHGLDLIAAFKLDAVKLRYADWRDLIEGYCMLSAAPVGRYLLDLHGEARSGYRASDALCNALQVLNHLQDCQDDYRQLDRVYLPQDWLAAAHSKVEDLDAQAASAGMRQVIDQCLDGSDELIAVARTLPWPAQEPAPGHGVGGHRAHRRAAEPSPAPARPAGRPGEALGPAVPGLHRHRRRLSPARPPGLEASAHSDAPTLSREITAVIGWIERTVQAFSTKR